VQLLPESDKAVALLAGGVTLALFVVGIAIVSVTSPSGVGGRELAGFAVGFGLFVAIYFVSMSADRVLRGDDKQE